MYYFIACFILWQRRIYSLFIVEIIADSIFYDYNSCIWWLDRIFYGTKISAFEFLEIKNMPIIMRYVIVR